MKYFLITTLIVISSISIVSCEKEVRKKNMKVIKNCTGTYLLLKEKNYKVCNTDVTYPYEDEDEVNASFTKIKECKAIEDLITCEMLFQFESYINVTNIE